MRFLSLPLRSSSVLSLLGVGGAGKKSALQLAAFVCGFRVVRARVPHSTGCTTALRTFRCSMSNRSSGTDVEICGMAGEDHRLRAEFQAAMATAVRDAGVAGHKIVVLVAEDVLRQDVCCGVLHEFATQTHMLPQLFDDEEIASIVKVSDKKSPLEVGAYSDVACASASRSRPDCAVGRCTCSRRRHRDTRHNQE